MKEKERLSFQQFHGLIEQSDDELSKKLCSTIKKIRKKREEIPEYRELPNHGAIRP